MPFVFDSSEAYVCEECSCYWWSFNGMPMVTIRASCEPCVECEAQLIELTERQESGARQEFWG